MSGEMPKCGICGEGIYEPAEQPAGQHESCRANFGLHALPASRRPARPCDRCGHHQLVRCLVRERGAAGNNYVASYVAPLQVTFARKVVTKEAFFSGKKSTEVTNQPAVQGQAVGVLEAYVCRQCGFTEWYTVEPEQLPIGEAYGTELIDVGPTTPYR
ncbi:MAG: hypothetical protein IT370_33505 [Deltaproteobacteria bacterium]|nr:hypothetical protein [Deltaproteobacteria bacterium]